MASLYARLTVEGGNVKLNTATLSDEQAAEINSEIDFAKDAVTWVPVVGDYADKAESVASLFGISTELPTDHALTVQQSNEQNFAVTESNVNVPLVQALLNANAVPAKDLNYTSPWLVNGQIDLSQPNAAADFATWLNSHPDIKDKLDSRVSQYQTQMGIQEGIAENKAGSGG